LSEASAVTPELEALLNVDLGPDVYEIEKGMLRRFAEAIDDPNPRWLQQAPPTFPAALVPTGLLHRLFNAPCPLTRLLNGASELEYFHPVEAGDTIAVTGRLTRLRQVAGKEGPSLFMFTEVTYTNQKGEVAVKGKNTYIKY